MPKILKQKQRSKKHLLSPEGAALSQTGLATGRLAKDGGASLADDNGLGVREDSGDGEAAGALHIHEEGPGSGHESLQLVLTGLRGRAGVEEIDSENHLEFFLMSMSEIGVQAPGVLMQSGGF